MERLHLVHLSGGILFFLSSVHKTKKNWKAHYTINCIHCQIEMALWPGVVMLVVQSLKTRTKTGMRHPLVHDKHTEKNCTAFGRIYSSSKSVGKMRRWLLRPSEFLRFKNTAKFFFLFESVWRIQTVINKKYKLKYAMGWIVINKNLII